MIHQPLDAEPSPPTLSLPTNVEALQTDGMKPASMVSESPFSAASVITWVQAVPVSMARKTVGCWAARVVIGSFTVGAVGSMVSETYSMSALRGDWARKALNELS